MYVELNWIWLPGTSFVEICSINLSSGFVGLLSHVELAEQDDMPEHEITLQVFAGVTSLCLCQPVTTTCGQA